MWRLEAEVHIPEGQCLPIDMLRYDTCFPKDSDAVHAASADSDEWRGDRPKKVVRVVQHSDYKAGYWTPARWQSFGVTLVPLPNETRKV